MKFIKKLKNNNAGAESAMFCMGCMIFLIILVFSFDIFKLTWQRYVVTREIENISRLYATRAMDLYYNPDGTQSYSNIKNSPLGKDMLSIVRHTVASASLHEMKIEIKKSTTSSCNNAGTTFLTITSNGSKSDITGVPLSTAKTTEYGTTFCAFATIKYNWDDNMVEEEKVDGYTITNKFAFENDRRDDDSGLN